MLVCFQYFAREAAGATAHPVFPAPSVLLEGNFMHPSGAVCAARMRIWVLTTSFRDGPKDQTWNLEIPGSMLCIAPE
jgi:hypothetical protein